MIHKSVRLNMEKVFFDEGINYFVSERFMGVVGVLCHTLIVLKQNFKFLEHFLVKFTNKNHKNIFSQFHVTQLTLNSL